MAAGLQAAIVEWASMTPSPFDDDDEADALPSHAEGYLTSARIADLLQAAVNDDEVDCDELITALAVGKALGKLLTRQGQGEPWLGILYRASGGRGAWCMVPVDPTNRDARAGVATALVEHLTAALHGGERHDEDHDVA